MTTQHLITCGLIAPPGFNKFCRNIAESSEKKLRSSIEFYGLIVEPWGDDIGKGRQAVLNAISLWTWGDFYAAVEKYNNYRELNPRHRKVETIPMSDDRRKQIRESIQRKKQAEQQATKMLMPIDEYIK